jgi:hypothetical protein
MRGARAQHRVASRAQYRAEVEVVFVYVWCEAETRLGGASPCRHSGMVWRWIGKNGDDVACATAHSDHWLTQQRNLPARAARKTRVRSQVRASTSSTTARRAAGDGHLHWSRHPIAPRFRSRTALPHLQRSVCFGQRCQVRRCLSVSRRSVEHMRIVRPAQKEERGGEPGIPNCLQRRRPCRKSR